MAADVDAVMSSLKRAATKKWRDDMTRYGIPNDTALGVTMGTLRTMSKALGKDHALAISLWKTGVYEARLLATLVDDPAQVTVAQMDRWCRDFDNWGICDTACFALFDRTPHAWSRVEKWSAKRNEFEKRAAFALLWSLSVHDKSSGDAPFLSGLALVERAADDERLYVKKGVSMALRAVGKRNSALNAAAVKTARATRGGRERIGEVDREGRAARTDERRRRITGGDDFNQEEGVTIPMTQPGVRSTMGRSIWAVAAAFVAVFVLSLGTDQVLHVLGVYPPWGQPMFEPGLNALALAYRCVFGVLGSYITARLAPHSPMKHVWAGAAIGFALSLAGAVAGAKMNLGPMWYPVALAFSVLPTSWIGGQLGMRSRTRV